MLIGISSLKAKGVQLLGVVGFDLFNNPDQRARFKINGCLSLIQSFFFSSFFSSSEISSRLSVLDCSAALPICLSPSLRCSNTSKFSPGFVVLAVAFRSSEWMQVQLHTLQEDCISLLSGVNVWHTLLSWPR